MKIHKNIGIVNHIPLLFRELVEDIRLDDSGDPDKSNVVSLTEDEDLVYVYHEKIGVWFVYQ